MCKIASPLSVAIARAGGQSALARAIGAKQQNVWDWLNKGNKQVPGKYAPAIEAATGVSRYELCPDIFGPPPTSQPAPASREVAA